MENYLEIINGKKERFMNLKMNITIVRDAVESGMLEDESLYPLDTFRYNPDVTKQLLDELSDCINNLSNELLSVNVD